MALLHKATLNPSKPELLAAYLMGVPALSGPGQGELSPLGAYRFDDPDGDVGIETHLVGWESGPVIHIPLTYRAQPNDAGEAWLVGTLEHSVLGTRWVYNACGDPVYAKELVRTMLTGGSQVEQYIETDEGRVYRDPTATVEGSADGTATDQWKAADSLDASFNESHSVIRVGDLEVVVRHLLSEQTAPSDGANATLTGTWHGADEPVVLAYTR
jgi:hypothetical protein